MSINIHKDLDWIVQWRLSGKQAERGRPASCCQSHLLLSLPAALVGRGSGSPLLEIPGDSSTLLRLGRQHGKRDVWLPGSRCPPTSWEMKVQPLGLNPKGDTCKLAVGSTGSGFSHRRMQPGRRRRLKLSSKIWRHHLLHFLFLSTTPPPSPPSPGFSFSFLMHSSLLKSPCALHLFLNSQTIFFFFDFQPHCHNLLEATSF